MKIHFVCTNNTFRSRLAETYLNSKKISQVIASSSGVSAANNPDGPITWYAQRIIKKQGLVPTEKFIWTQTTQKVLEEVDLVIFMQKWHYDQCVKKFKFKGANYEVWDVEDIVSANLPDDMAIIQKSEDIYTKIKTNIEDLISRNFKATT